MHILWLRLALHLQYVFNLILTRFLNYLLIIF
jgi:hypothetical protein